MKQFEERLSALADEWIKSNAFLKPVTWGLQRGVHAQAAIKQSKQKVFELWGVVTHPDIEHLHQRVDLLERALERSIESESLLAQRVTQLEAMIEAMGDLVKDETGR